MSAAVVFNYGGIHHLLYNKGISIFSQLWICLILYHVVGDSGLTVCQINDAAAPEAVFVQHMLHHRIVMMGVDAHIGT